MMIDFVKEFKKAFPGVTVLECSKIFIMIISPKNISGPHIQLLAGIGSLLNDKKSRDILVSCKNKKEVYSFFIKKR